MRRISGWLLVALLVPCAAHAQSRSTSNAAGEIRGRLVDATTNQPLESGVVTVLRSRDSVVAREARADSSGAFRVERLAVGRYIVRVRSLGFSPIVRDDVVVATNHRVVDFGTVALSATASQVAGQVVTAERADVTLAPNRNSYAAKNMTAAAGGTAIDVLRNVPSVEVDVTNQVSLRGNQGVVIQINGRPSPLKGEQLGNFLAQLPASSVKRVEVSANPSAKNDPDGTAGIINIILNEDTSLGWSGGWTLATGTTGQATASGNVGHQAGPFTAFLSYGVNRNHQNMDGRSQIENLQSSMPALVSSHVDGATEPIWQNSTFRAEYLVTPQDALSFDGTVSGGTLDRDNTASSTDLDDTGAVIGRFNQANGQHTQYVTQDYALAFRRTGDAKARAFSTEARITRTDGTIATMLSGNVLQGNASTGALAIPTERDREAVGWPTWTLQSDYTEPFGGATGTKLELGVKEQGQRTSNDFTASVLDSATRTFMPNAARSNAFDYREQIGAAYALLTQKIAKLQAQAGLRLEQATSALSLDARRVDNNYASAFPSALLSYDFAATRQAKVSYSRRITRPDPFQLDPAVYHVDARTAYVGNEHLRPEYTDAFELGFQETRGWGSIQLNPYARYTAHAVRTILSVDSSGTTIGTYDNVASTRQVGTDLNSTIHLGSSTLLIGGNASHYSSDATNLAGNPSTRAFVWSARVNATWQATHAVDAQLSTNYRSAFATEGGLRRAFVFMNVSMRKKLWHDQGSVTIRAQDPFNLLTFGSITTSPETVQSSVQSYGIRGLFISVTRNLGQEIKLRPADNQGAPPAPNPPGDGRR